MVKYKLEASVTNGRNFILTPHPLLKCSIPNLSLTEELCLDQYLQPIGTWEEDILYQMV